MSETLDFVLTGIRSGDLLVYAGISALTALLTYALVRRLMRVGWLRLVMRLAFFGGVVALVVIAGFSLSYYQWQAWLPLGTSMLNSLFSVPTTWVATAGLVATGLALRKPVPRRYDVYITEPSAPVLQVPPGPLAEQKPDHGGERPWRSPA